MWLPDGDTIGVPFGSPGSKTTLGGEFKFGCKSLKILMEATTRIELVYTVLQTVA